MGKVRIIALLLVFFVHVNVVLAIIKSDSLYIKPFSRRISTRVLLGIKEFSISIGNGSKLISSNPKVIYKPNNGVIGGIGISYRNILISYYFKVPGTELSNQAYGNTSISDYQINLTNRFFYFSGFHRIYNGFYVSRPYESYPDWDKSLPYPQRQDIHLSTMGFETIINLNPRRYSLNASLKLTEQQLRSAFSGLIYANYSFTSVSADSSLIPSHLRSLFFDGKELHQSNFSGWTVMPGISYAYVSGRWFLNPMLFSGLGYSHKELLFEMDGSENYHDYYFRINCRLNYGYNSKRVFAGVFFEWNEIFLPEEGFSIKTENLNAMLMLGFRF